MWRPNYYRILQVSPEASQEEIRSSYRRLALRYHPDGTDPDPQLMRLLNEAYEVLRDPAKRRQYDLFLTLHLRHPGYRPPSPPRQPSPAPPRRPRGPPPYPPPSSPPYPGPSSSPRGGRRPPPPGTGYRASTRTAARPDYGYQSDWVIFADVVGLSAGGVYGWLIGLLVGGAIGSTVEEIGAGAFTAILIAFILPFSIWGIYNRALLLAAPHMLESLPLPVRNALLPILKALRFATLGAVGGAMVGVLGRATDWPLSCILIGLLPLLLAWRRRAQG
jgi:hypothetical protein